MILDIALGIVIAALVLSTGKNGVLIALVAAAFYFGFGPLAILLGLLWGVIALIVWTCDKVGDRRDAERRRQKMELIETLSRRPRELEWRERIEPRFTVHPPPAQGRS